MVALQIRDVPDDVREALVTQARARGQSLQAFLLALVQEEARRLENRTILDRFAGRSDGSRLSVSEAADAVDAARAGRESHLADGPPAGLGDDV